MKKLLKSGAAVILLAGTLAGFTACSDDNDEPAVKPENPDNTENPTPGAVNPSNVFTGLMPKSVGGTTITRNTEGLVTEMRTADGKVITFEYPEAARAGEDLKGIRMTVVKDDVKTEYDMTVGVNGFVSESSVKVTSGQPGEDEEGDWTFTYDSNGHLTNARHAYKDMYGDDVYSVTLEWNDGNIVKTYKDNGWDNYTYSYTSGDYPAAIENKGAIFMFEDIYPIEIYGFEWVYYAGMLGKGPKNLAVSHSEKDEDEAYTTEFVWTLDRNGYPTVFDIKDDDHPGESTVKFTWN